MEVQHFTGGCFCGKVRLAIEAAPSRVGICHCRDCRKQYGGIFYMFAVFPDTAVTVTGETAQYGARHFCPVCGSSVFDRRGSEIEINAGALDSDNIVRPTYETWVCRRERWLPAFPVDHRYERDRE
jgi:hypothetical protein